MICAEDVPFLPEKAPVDNDYFQYDIQTIRKTCEVVPHDTLPERYRQPLKSNLPVLILTGEDDPVTPPRNSAVLASGLPNSRQLVVPGMGHNLLFQGCLPKLVSDFITQKDASKLDLSCVKRIQPMPFFISPLGPQP